MGRKYPGDENSLFDPTISFPFLIASMAATIAIITNLCGTRFWKKTSPPPSASPDKITEILEMAQPSTTVPQSEIKTNSELKIEKEETPEILPPLKLPPIRMLNQSSSYSYHNSNSTNEAGLNSTMSLKVPRSMSVAKNRSRKEDRSYKKKEKVKADDSVWMKTIILGEKCKVPDDEDEAILYDDKGKRVTTFHAKTQSSLPPSRTCSYIDPQAIPGSVFNRCRQLWKRILHCSDSLGFAIVENFSA